MEFRFLFDRILLLFLAFTSERDHGFFVVLFFIDFVVFFRVHRRGVLLDFVVLEFRFSFFLDVLCVRFCVFRFLLFVYWLGLVDGL